MKTNDIILATAPVLAEHGRTITSCFYKNLFHDHPSLMGVFNMSHQGPDFKGSQPHALAQAVHAYAVNINNLGALTEAVTRIAHKHVTHGVLPEHYPVVGEYLLAAIKEVLGAAATPEILAAWEEAYGALAQIFINMESKLQAELEQRPGGWRGFRLFRVIRRVGESDGVVSFYLEPVDGKGICPYSAGQYICLRLKIPGQEWPVVRNYTVSVPPGEGHLRITVKKEEAASPGGPPGLASHFLHTVVHEGDEVELGPPSGIVALPPAVQQPLVLISAGIGITPMISMLREAIKADAGVTIHFIHTSRHEDAHPLREEVSAVAAAHPAVRVHYVYTRRAAPGAVHGRLTAQMVKQFVDGAPSPPGADTLYYICGPSGFLSDMERGLVAEGVDPATIHLHTFGPI